MDPVARLRKETANRFRLFRLMMGVDIKELGKVLRRRQAYLQDVESATLDVDYKLYVSLKKKYGLSTEWLSAGIGNMFVSKITNTPIEVYIKGNCIGLKNKEYAIMAEVVDQMTADHNLWAALLQRYNKYKETQNQESPIQNL